MNTDHVRQGITSNHIKRVLLGGICLLALGLATAAGSSPAAAKYKLKNKDARKETEHVKKLPFGDIPKGPLEIFVSINQQKLHFYSGGVHVADALVATGVPGHLTPLGVFSVIQRDRFHHSNIYSNAPMPYMERITWSGVALHQGPGVGRQASHGCIRMPEDFAARLWQLPTMGMRVIIARGELRPTEFADPHLFVHKAPAPTAAVTPAVQTAQTINSLSKTDAVDPPAGTAAAPTAPAGKADPVDSHAEAAPAAASQPSSMTAKPDPAATTAAQPIAPAAPTTAATTAQAETQTAGSATTTPGTPAATQAAQPSNATESLAATIKSAATDATEQSKPTAPAPAEPAKANTATSATTEAAPANPAVTAPANSVEATQATPPASAQPAPAAPAQATTTGASAPAAAAASSTTPAPAEAAGAAAANLTAPISLDDVPIPLAKPIQLGKSGGGPIAIFVSRKNSRIYVRQDFSPVFDAPVKIENPNQPIGTHVFTAIDYLPDHSTFRWTVTTLPGEPPRAEEHWKYVRDAYGNRKRVRVSERGAESAEPVAAPETPQEALARIAIPQDVIDQISQLMVPGSSLVVSDQGLGPETGSGTDFIVVQR